MLPTTSGAASPPASAAYAVGKGHPHPLGATVQPEGVNFSLFSEHATGVELLLFEAHDPPQPLQVVSLHLHVNGQMPNFVVDRVQNALNDRGKALKGAHVHILGVAYKRDIDDMRESPALDIMHLLQRRHARFTYSDPYVPELRADSLELRSQPPEEASAQADCVLVITNHAAFDYAAILEKASLIVDTRNALKGFVSDKIVRL